MDNRTLTALQGSIAKWEAIARGEGRDDGTSNCPLCAEFWEDRCGDCPVRARTGRPFCNSSPYAAWDEHFGGSGGPGHYASTKEARELAQAELDFLRSLLPVEAA